jgi:hypothetical protein
MQLKNPAEIDPNIGLHCVKQGTGEVHADGDRIRRRRQCGAR